MARVLLFVIPFAVTLYALIDALMAPRERVRLMSKWLWALVIILLWIVGALLWFFLGRPKAGKPGIGETPEPKPDKPKPIRPTGPDDDPEFLRSLK